MRLHEEGDFLEMTSIDFHREGIGEIKPESNRESWVGDYASDANITIEIWTALLFIEARSVSINGERFTLR